MNSRRWQLPRAPRALVPGALLIAATALSPTLLHAQAGGAEAGALEDTLRLITTGDLFYVNKGVLGLAPVRRDELEGMLVFSSLMGALGGAAETNDLPAALETVMRDIAAATGEHRANLARRYETLTGRAPPSVQAPRPSGRRQSSSATSGAAPPTPGASVSGSPASIEAVCRPLIDDPSNSLSAASKGDGRRTCSYNAHIDPPFNHTLQISVERGDGTGRDGCEKLRAGYESLRRGPGAVDRVEGIGELALEYEKRGESYWTRGLQFCRKGVWVGGFVDIYTGKDDPAIQRQTWARVEPRLREIDRSLAGEAGTRTAPSGETNPEILLQRSLQASAGEIQELVNHGIIDERTLWRLPTESAVEDAGRSLFGTDLDALSPAQRRSARVFSHILSSASMKTRDGDALFPSLNVSLPVVTAMARNAGGGDASAERALGRYVNLLAGMDVRALRRQHGLDTGAGDAPPLP